MYDICMYIYIYNYMQTFFYFITIQLLCNQGMKLMLVAIIKLLPGNQWDKTNKSNTRK